MMSVLDNVPEGKHFITVDGHSIKNYEELQVALNAMSDESYAHHANDSKNDFRNWVKNVHEDDDLAARLISAKNRRHAKKQVSRRIKSARNVQENKVEQPEIKKSAPNPPSHLAEKQVIKEETSGKSFIGGSRYQLSLGMAIGLLVGLFIGRLL